MENLANGKPGRFVIYAPQPCTVRRIIPPPRNHWGKSLRVLRRACPLKSEDYLMVTNSAPEIGSQLVVDERTAAKMLSVSVRTMFTLRKMGLPYFRIGSGTKAVRYRVSSIEQWVADQELRSDKAN